MFLLMDIGCIECGAQSRVVIKTADLSKAQRLQSKCEEQYGIVAGGKHKFMILPVPEDETVNERYNF